MPLVPLLSAAKENTEIKNREIWVTGHFHDRAATEKDFKEARIKSLACTVSDRRTGVWHTWIPIGHIQEGALHQEESRPRPKKQVCPPSGVWGKEQTTQHYHGADTYSRFRLSFNISNPQDYCMRAKSSNIFTCPTKILKNSIKNERLMFLNRILKKHKCCRKEAKKKKTGQRLISVNSSKRKKKGKRKKKRKKTKKRNSSRGRKKSRRKKKKRREKKN